MDLPILRYTADQGEDQLVEHEMTDEEKALLSELDEASAAVESDDPEDTYAVITPIGAAHGLSKNETIAFWVRTTFAMFEPAEYSLVPELARAKADFNELTFTALDHGFESIKEAKAPLIPFVMMQTNGGERRLERFVTERLEEGVERAKRYVDEHASDIAMYAVAWDGYVTLDGAKADAVFVEAGTAAKAEAKLLCQRYQLKKGFFRKRNVIVGNPVLVDTPPSRIYTPKP